MKDIKYALDQADKEGFYFFDLNYSHDFCFEILNQNFEYIACGVGRDAPFQTILSPALKNKLIETILQYFCDANFFQQFNFTSHYFAKNGHMYLHNDSKELGDYQFLSWICESSEFEGREFLYGDIEHVNSARPYTGLSVILNNKDKKYRHGVSKLLTDEKIVTICGSIYY